MAGKTLTSSLIVRLVDQVSGPARKVGAALLGINRNMGGGFGLQLKDAMERNEQALGRARQKMLDVVGGLYLLREALGTPLRSAADFETALEDIGQKAGIPTEKLGALGEQIRKIATDTNQATMSIAAAVDSLVGRGASQDVALAAASPIGKAATAYRAATDDLAAAAYSAVDNLKVPADQIGTALDYMAQAGKDGAFELRDMAQYFPAIAAQYQGLGETGVDAVADLAAALQIVRKGTGDASTAATNLQNVLQKVYANTTVSNFKKLGINIRKEMERAAKAGMTPIEAIAQITNKALKGDLSKLGLIFEDAQVQAGMRSLIQNFEEYRAIREKAFGAEGVVDEDFQRRIATAQGAMDRWNATIQNLNITIGSTLVPLLNGLLDKILPVVTAIGDWAAANPELARTIISVTAGLIGFKLALSTLSFVGLLGQGGALSLVAAAFRTIAFVAPLAEAAVGALAAGFGAITAPVAAVIAAVVGAGFLIWKYWDRLSSIFTGVAQAISEQLAPAIEPIRPALDWLGGVGKMIGDGFKQAWDAIAGFFGQLFSQEKLTDAQKEEMRQAGYNAVMAILDGMKSMFAGVLQWFATWPQQILAAIGSIDIGSLFQWPTMPTWLGGQAQAGPTQPNAKINGVEDPGLPGGSVTGRARGGNMWAGSTYQINEEGEEFFSPKSSVVAHKAGQGPAALRGGGDVHIGQLVIQEASNAHETARAVKEELRNLLRGAHSDSMART